MTTSTRIAPPLVRRLPWLVLLVLVAAGCAAPRGGRSAKSDGPLHHYQLARMHFEQGRVPESLEEIETSLRLDGSLPQVHHYRGYIYWNLEQWHDAAASFERALELQPYYTDARMFLATCLENLGRVDDALAQLDRAERDRTFGAREKVYVTRAMIYKRQGRLGDALADLRQAVELRPRYYRAHYEMALVLDGMDRLDEAIAAFDAAEPGYAENARFHLDKGRALFRHGLLPAAALQLRRAMEIAPGSESAAQARELLEVID